MKTSRKILKKEPITIFGREPKKVLKSFLTQMGVSVIKLRKLKNGYKTFDGIWRMYLESREIIKETHEFIMYGNTREEIIQRTIYEIQMNSEDKIIAKLKKVEKA